MDNKFIIAILVVALIAAGGYWYLSKTKTPETPVNGMTEAQARVIAQNLCTAGGGSLAPSGTFNENSKTWWFDAQLANTPSGCNPACVVSAETKTAEINWRCTGLIPPAETTVQALQKVFEQKYPQYVGAVAVTIDQETADHVRGSVLFGTGGPGEGGLFFAVKKADGYHLVFDGNGDFSCTLLEQNGFPKDMQEGCH